MAEYIDNAYATEDDETISVPEHLPSDLLILYRKQVSEKINELQGWDNQSYRDSNGLEYMLSWTIDRIGNISEIDYNNSISVLLIYRNATIGSIGISDNTVNDMPNTSVASPITSSNMPVVPTTLPGPSLFAFFASNTSGGSMASISGPVVTRFVETRTVYGSTHTPQRIPGRIIISDTGNLMQTCPSAVASYAGPASGIFNITAELISGIGAKLTTKSITRSAVTSCAGKIEIIDGTTVSTNDLENARDLIAEVGSDMSDPIADEYEGYIANGNNNRGTTGIQDPLPIQTSRPTPSPTPAKQTIDTPPPQLSASGVVCTPWDGRNYDIPVSQNFTLRNFTIGYTDKSLNYSRGCLYPNKLIDIPGYPAQTRFCNLQALSTRVLEPLWAKFGPFRINSAIRNQNSVSNGVSQHVTGEAVDIQFPGWSYEMYWENAKWIKDNLPYDQFIYEHSAKSGSVWYHLSFRQTGNRPNTDRTKVMTMYRGHYDPGLKRYQ